MATTYTLISSVTVGSGGAANIEFTSIPATYTDLLVKLSARSARAAAATDFVQINLNSSASDFTARGLEGNGAAAISFTDTVFLGAISSAGGTASTFGSLELYIPNYLRSNNKSFSTDSVSENNATTAFAELTAGLWSQTTAISSIKILSATANNFLQYTTAYLYGISNA
jgi:hypothetical protein